MRLIRLFSIFTFLLLKTPSVDGQCNFNIDENGIEWVDSIYSSLTMEERIAQLFWIAIEPKNQLLQAKNIDWINSYQPGGIIFFKTQAEELVDLSNTYQKLSMVPLTVAIDGEWGLGMRLTDVPSFPFQMTLGAIQNDSLIYEMGMQVGHQMKAMGIHVNLAPVVDVNNNADNPVIGKRSFGELPLNVALKSWAYAKGMQEAGIIAVAKHFPGHGDTNKDSHHTLPLISHDFNRLDSVELIPFKHVIDSGIMGVMTAHLSIPSLETELNRPSGLSKAIVSDLLKDSLGFDGLVVSDAMNMRGVSQFAKRGELELQALLAGNDVVEFTSDLPLAIKVIMEAIEIGRFDKSELEAKCKKVLALKYWSGLANYKLIDKDAITEATDSPEAGFLNHRLHAASITVLKNSKDLLPFRHLDTLRAVALCFDNKSEWQDNFWRFKQIDVHQFGGSEYQQWLSQKKDEYVIILLKDFKTYKKNKAAIDELLENRRCILAFSGNAYKLEGITKLGKAQSIVLTYQNNSTSRDVLTQMLFGAISANGKLPVTINAKYPAGSGLNVKALNRLSHSFPEAVGMDSKLINKQVDSIANAGIEMGAFPGCRVLVALRGQVIFNQAYGYHTYKKKHQVQIHDVFDLASVTKITGPLPLLMKGVDEGLINLDAPFSDYWPDWQNRLFHRSNKKNLIFRDVLAHQAALTPYINYYPMTMVNGAYQPKYYSSELSEKYDLAISNHLYLSSKFKKVVYKAIRKSPMLEKKEYKYSGLSFMIYPELLTELFGEEYEAHLYQYFYQPLGASSLGYNPLSRINEERILPTEEDFNFRYQLSKGRVHDEAAAIMGGVSGNAGLFSTAVDLAKMMQMYLQKGSYGGVRYLSENVVNEFIKVQFPENNNRRGLGFDKPLFGNDTLSIEKSYPAPGVSASSFGHSGYTGTFVWIDPEYQLVYIFLSNRVYPTRENPLIYRKNIRPSIQQVFYNALESQKN